MPALKSQSISSLVRNSRFPYLAGRTMGVKLRFVQIPCKSGWPSDVYDNFQGFFSAVLVAVCALPAVFAPGVVWAASSAGTARGIAIAAARVPARERLRMVLPRFTFNSSVMVNTLRFRRNARSFLRKRVTDAPSVVTCLDINFNEA